MASIKDLVKGRKLNAFEKALLVAQKNAALPKSEGGLGLSALNTPEERSAAMGAIDYLHGTQRLDRLLQGKSLDPKRATSGPMPFGTESPELASTYAMNKSDTSRIATDEGNMADYFQVSPKSLGQRGTSPYSVERSYYLLSPEKQAELLENYYRVGYADPDQAMGNFVLHPKGEERSIASKQHLDYILKREGKGNPLSALRALWGESGELYDEPGKLADVYRVAGYPHEISQANAPWFEAKGVLTGKAMVQNPLQTQNHEQILSQVVPALEQAFKNDRSRKIAMGADPWDKRARFTPKEWVEQLKTDLSSGENSHVWTSIPDKVTAELKKLGYDSILDISGKGGGAERQVVIPFEPSQVRSRFAAFDPMRRSEANLLASHPLASAGAAMAASGGLSGMAKEYLNQPMYQGPEMARASKYTGIYPMTRLENLKNTLSALPVTGEMLSAAEGLQAASEGKWGEAGLGALGALPMVSGAIKASHGSPHAFERFDLSKMGTGEGAQAYGHGAYFGQGFDSPVAKEYMRDQRGASASYLAKTYLKNWGDKSKALEALDLRIAKMADEVKPEYLIPYQEARSRIASESQDFGPYLYNVSLEWPNAAREAADPLSEHHLLDWDAKLSEQPDLVKSKLLDLMRKRGFPTDESGMPLWATSDPTGEAMYASFNPATAKNNRQAQKLASQFMQQAGIPGLKYLDQGSRLAGQGTSNYVIFDENIPRIVSRNGVSLTDLLRK